MYTSLRRSLYLAAAFLLFGTSATVAQPADLFFSEYIEGSSFNKAIEIYNGTGSAVDLSAYTFEIYYNGSTSAGATLPLSGTLADGNVYIIADDGAEAAILAEADQTPGFGFFNGDDAVVLSKGGATVDVIGQIGFDPGSEWGSGNTSTQNNTLRRMATACTGDTDGSDAFDPSTDYDGFATDTFDGLGAHTATCGGGGPGPGPVAERLLLTELAVTPTAGEFIEIYNPGASAVDLSDYYLTDATFAGGGTFYYNIVTGADAGGGGFADFHARFPDGASIAPGAYQTVALDGSDGFVAEYGVAPTYELYEDGASADGVPDMREALPGSINDQGGLTNGGEFTVLYFWDGQSDLVTDVDYAVWGDKAEAVDKTGVSIDGPDADSDASTYLPDTAIASQAVIAPGSHATGQTFTRIDLDEGTETQTGGNGVGGADETSENLGETWAERAPSPNAAAPTPPPATPALVINEILADPAGDLTGDANGDGTRDGSADEFVEIVNTSTDPVDISGWTLSDGVGVRHTFPAGTIVDGQCGLVVFGGGTPTGAFGSVVVQTASEGALGFNNGGDTVTLAEAGGTVVATETYGGEGGDNQSLTRDPDITGTFVQHSTASGSGGALFSPGTQLDGTRFTGCAAPPPPPVEIAECQLDSYAPQTLFPGLTGQDLIDALIAAYKPDPGNMPADYGVARDFMYAQIDNMGGTLEGVYSGFTLTGVPENLATARTYAQDNGFNAEHTWPQSRGIESDEPGARSDLHHLFPTLGSVNSARSSYPFAEIPDTATDRWYINTTSQSSIPATNIDGYSEADFEASPGVDLPFEDRRFEPREIHEGNAARAVFYVAAIYQSLVSDPDEQAFLNAQLAAILNWNDLDPVDQAEYVRTCGIGAIQDGKVNPFVIDPTLAARAFASGVTVVNVQRTPLVPAADEVTTVTADVVASAPVTSVELRYQVNGGAEVAVPMTATTGAGYTGAIPASAYTDSDRVEYRVFAATSEASNASSTQGFFAGTTPIATLNDRDADGVLRYLGYGARVSGVGTVDTGTFSDVSLEVYLQDATGGISLFRGGDTFTPFAAGTQYTVTGVLEQFNGKTQLEPVAFVDEGPAPVSPLVVTIADLLADPEAYENELLRINGVTPAGPFPPAGSSGNVPLEDGTTPEALTMRIDNETGITGADEPLAPYDVVGIFTQFDSDGVPLDDGYQILPRSAADLVGEAPPPPPPPTPMAGPWINEFHYDNDGTDTGEFVEVAVPMGTDLDGLELVLYNGSNQSPYNTIPFADFAEGATEDGITFYSIVLPTNGLQNGAPDGLALCAGGTVVQSGITPQFLSYEGIFEAAEGCAAGLTSLDVGVSEPGNAPIGSSLALVGTPAESPITYDSYAAWMYLPAGATPGAPNGMQAICRLTTLTEEVTKEDGQGVVYATFENVDGIAAIDFTLLDNFVVSVVAPAGAGTPPADPAAPGTWTFDSEPTTIELRLEQADASVRSATYFAVARSVCGDGLFATDFDPPHTFDREVPDGFALDQNYPNPFNPTTQITFALPEAADAQLVIYDVTGRAVATLVREPLAAGRYTVGWDGRNQQGRLVPSGVYLYRLQAGALVQTRTMTLLK